MIRSVRKIEVVDCQLAVHPGKTLEECVKCNFYKELTLEGVDCEYKAKGDEVKK